MGATFGKPVQEANAWWGSALRPNEWVRTLSPPMIAEVAKAVGAARAERIAAADLTVDSFPLPQTAPLLDAARNDLENGRGFVVLRGWPAERFGYEENLTALCGIDAHLGRIVVQNYEGDRIVDVTDRNKPYSHASRGYQSRALLPFHSDGADLVTLLCLGEPASGGESLLVSATALYNTILEECPEILPVLERGFYHHRRGQHDPGEHPLSAERVPVFTFHGGYLHCCYNRNPIEWAEKEGVRLSAEERAALDRFDALIARPGMAVRLDFRLGDIQCVNNFVILHSRTAYEDSAERKRHLVRIWLHSRDSKRNGQSLLDLYAPAASRFRARPTA